MTQTPRDMRVCWHGDCCSGLHTAAWRTEVSVTLFSWSVTLMSSSLRSGALLRPYLVIWRLPGCPRLPPFMSGPANSPPGLSLDLGNVLLFVLCFLVPSLGNIIDFTDWLYVSFSLLFPFIWFFWSSVWEIFSNLSFSPHIGFFKLRECTLLTRYSSLQYGD